MPAKMNIPFFGIDRLYANHAKDILKAVDTVFTHGKVLMGPEVEDIEKDISLYCNRKYAVTVGSCTDALYFALLSGGIGKGDEVLITSFSFVASVSAILRAEAIPVFVDIDPKYYMMDLSDLERKVTRKTKAILAVNLFGQTLPMDRLEEIAKKHNLVLIEDTAQSLGGKWRGRPAGSMGLISCISFDPTKIVGAFGNGGVLLTDDEGIHENAVKLRYHGKNMKSGEFEILGYNSRLATSQAAILRYQLKHLDFWSQKRREIADFYKKELEDLGGLQLPEVQDGCDHIFHKFVMQCNARNDLRAHLADAGIKTMIHYNKALFEHPMLDHYDHRKKNVSVVHDIIARVLSLPIYPELKDEEMRYITDSIKAFYASR